MLRTGDLANLVGCSARTIRQKSDRGQLPVAASDGRYRLYDEEAIVKYYRDTNMESCTIVNDKGEERIPKNLLLCSNNILVDYVAWQCLRGYGLDCKLIFGSSLQDIINNICKEGVFDTLFVSKDLFEVGKADWLFKRLGSRYINLYESQKYRWYIIYNTTRLVESIFNYQVSSIIRRVNEEYKFDAETLRLMRRWEWELRTQCNEWVDNKISVLSLELEESGQKDNKELNEMLESFKLPSCQDSLGIKDVGVAEYFSIPRSGMRKIDKIIPRVYRELFSEKSLLYNIRLFKFEEDCNE